MPRLGVLLLLPCLLGQAPAPSEGSAARSLDKGKRDRLLALFREDAAKYSIHLDAGRKNKVELKREPVSIWSNPLRSGGQYGAVFVWTYRGRPEVIGSIFSAPDAGPRRITHELHSLALSTLEVSRPGPPSWTPEGPGLALRPVAGAPAPAETAKARLAQMRALLRDFSANTRDKDDVRWELRPLTHALFRYESTDPAILDGCLFGYVSSAGTDPELILAIEARAVSPGARPVWQYGVARFTDLDLWVREKGAEVYAAPRCVWNDPRQDPQHRYRLFLDRRIPAIEEEAR